MGDGNNNNDTNRKRKVIWLKPPPQPFCKLLTINIRRYFNL